MRISIRFPSKAKNTRFLKEKQAAAYTYQALHGTREESISGYDNDHNFILLGEGEATWNKAKAALDNWQQFPALWTKIYDEQTPLEPNQVVAVIFKLFGIWWSNAAKIVYTIDESKRYGFAYGTLEGHVESGEECFWIERDETGKVYYHIKAFSKPKFWGARLTYPLSRSYQRKFVHDSMAQMKALANQ